MIWLELGLNDFVILGKICVMEANEILTPEGLTSAQLDIYRMFSVRLPEEEWKEIADLLSGYIISKRVDPEILSKSPTRLNEQQLQMLNLFKSPMPENDYKEIKKLVVINLAKRADEELEKIEKEKGWSAETYEQWGNEHMRTPYKQTGW
jgi:hypothetical protein